MHKTLQRPSLLRLSLTASVGLLALGGALISSAVAGPEESNQHTSRTTNISTGNVNRLKLAWFVKTNDPCSHMPLVQNGRVYFADWGGDVYCVNAGTGSQVWKKTGLEKPKKMWPWHGFAGTGALGGGMLFEASVEGNAFAMDAETGRVMWKKHIATNPSSGSLARILYHDGMIFVGLQSVEEALDKKKPNFKPSFRGEVLALNAKTGETMWRRSLVAAPGNGVAVWSSFALDAAANRLYFTTGNNYTGEATDLSDSMVAVDSRTGEIVWHKQTLERDVWTKAEPKGPDYDFAGGAQIFDAMINGKTRKLVGAGQKSGIYWVWDRESGEPVWHTTVGYGAIDGGIHGEASFGNGRVYVWSNNGYLHPMPPQKHPLNIMALDAATGKRIWAMGKMQPAWLNSAGFLSNDVYLMGSLDGHLRAYRAADGKKLWVSDTAKGPIVASLAVAGSSVFFPTATPKIFGKWAKGQQGVAAYRLR